MMVLFNRHWSKYVLHEYNSSVCRIIKLKIGKKISHVIGPLLVPLNILLNTAFCSMICMQLIRIKNVIKCETSGSSIFHVSLCVKGFLFSSSKSTPLIFLVKFSSLHLPLCYQRKFSICSDSLNSNKLITKSILKLHISWGWLEIMHRILIFRHY